MLVDAEVDFILVCAKSRKLLALHGNIKEGGYLDIFNVFSL